VFTALSCLTKWCATLPLSYIHVDVKHSGAILSFRGGKFSSGVDHDYIENLQFFLKASFPERQDILNSRLSVLSQNVGLVRSIGGLAALPRSAQCISY
jgi:hypothetical protein